MEIKYTHRELVELAYGWVMRRAHCGFAFKELYTLASEIPDVIGFGASGHSVLIECKISRADFLADKTKPHRMYTGYGMGKFRLYCAPQGIITVEDLPLKWGLLWVDDNRKIWAVIDPIARSNGAPGTDGDWRHEYNNTMERHMMYSALRRLQLRGRMEEIYYDPSTIEKPTKPGDHQ